MWKVQRLSQNALKRDYGSRAKRLEAHGIQSFWMMI